MSGKIKKSKADTIDLLEYRDVVVTDDWYPCWPGNEAHMRLHMFKLGKEYKIIFSVFGADDFGVVMRYDSSSINQTHSVYKLWKQYIFDRVPNGVTVEWFYEHGFYQD